jgi:nucleoside-diphosphate-sugar epimerase
MITVLGGSGFIGSRLVRHLQAAGHPCSAPARGERLEARDLGHVVYCVGMTGDFALRPDEGVEAHVCKLLDLVTSSRFESFVYLSSTRLYRRHRSPTAREEDELTVSPESFDDLYNLSKALGESIVLARDARVHVVRLSNVYGGDPGQHTFLSSLITDAVTRRAVTLETSLESARDYVAVSDVVEILARIAVGGRQRVYNLASGVNVTNGEVVRAIARITGCAVAVVPEAPTVVYPEIEIERARGEFGFEPSSLLRDLPQLIESYAHD